MTYRPTDDSKDPAVQRELLRVSAEFERSRRLPVKSTEPQRPADGDQAIADGVNWNPIGDGIKRPVWYDAALPGWRIFS